MRMDFKTTSLALHLDNFVQITNITCKSTHHKEETIHIDFCSQIHAEAAFDMWSLTPNLLLLVSHERKCNHGNPGTYFVNEMTLVGNRITARTKHSVPRVAIMTDWELNIEQKADKLQIEHPNGAHPTRVELINKDEHKPEKREFLTDLKTGLRDYKIAAVETLKAIKNIPKSISLPFTQAYDIKFNKTRSRYFDLDSNYNITTKASKKRIPFINVMQGVVTCLNCFTHGYVDIKLQLRGRMGVLLAYKLKVVGGIEANIDVRVVYNHEFGQELAPIFRIPLLPFNIKDVLSIAPEFRVEAGWTWEGWGQVGMNFGFHVSVPLNLEMSSEEMKDHPTFIQEHSSERVSLNAHALEMDSGMSGWLSIQINPVLIWGFNFHHHEGSFPAHGDPSTFIRIYNENILAISVSVGAPVLNCPSERATVEIYQDHALRLQIITPIFGKRFQLYRFKNSVFCWFCDRCGVAITDVAINYLNANNSTRNRTAVLEHNETRSSNSTKLSNNTTILK